MFMMQDFMQEHHIEIGRDKMFDLLDSKGLLIRKRKCRIPRTTYSDHWMRKYPNPFSNTATLEIINWKNQNYKLMIYNMVGEKVYSSQISNPISHISLDLPSGMYFYKVEDNKQIIGNGKIIVQ